MSCCPKHQRFRPGIGPALCPKHGVNHRFAAAEYGFRTAGIVDIQTKSGAALNGGSAEVYGGSYDTIRPSFEYRNHQGNSSFFINGSYDHNDLGIENPAPTSVPVHDYTDQYKTFMYFSHIMDPTSRIIVMGSLSYSHLKSHRPRPNQYSGAGRGAWVPSGGAAPSPLALNDNQNEQNYYAVVAYQKSSGDLNYQLSAFGRDSSAHYVPGNIDATLDYNDGVATDENRILYSGGAQWDLSYTLGDHHTLRGGLLYTHEAVTVDTTTTVFDTGATTPPP